MNDLVCRISEELCLVHGSKAQNHLEESMSDLQITKPINHTAALAFTTNPEWNNSFDSISSHGILSVEREENGRKRVQGSKEVSNEQASSEGEQERVLKDWEGAGRKYEGAAKEQRSSRKEQAAESWRRVSG